MTVRLALPALALALALLPAPAGAELPPYVYERARDAATSVVVVDIARVVRPKGAFASGTCEVHGAVTSVERGSLHEAGQPIAVLLPCIGSRFRPMPGPFPGYSAEKLGKARWGRFFLKGNNLVLRGYDQLTP